jgi:type IV pilus assembly protein PilQ
MRGKQLLGIFLMTLLLSLMAAAAGLQLTAVSMSTQDNTTTITIRASGAFTHTEYRPADNLLLIDLPGVSAGVLDGQKQSVQNPGVSGYRVQSFQGTGGTDVARVELNLSGAPFATFNQNQDALEVRITPVDAPAAAATPAPAVTLAPVPPASPAAPAPPASQTVPPAPASAPATQNVETTLHQAAKANQPVWVRAVNVIHGQQGVEVGIRSSGALKPTVTKISDPERIVVDLENARTLRPVQVPVKQDNIKGVRMALHEVNPPVTRVVVDLEAPRDYELVPTDKGLLLKLRAPAQVASLGAPPVAPSAGVMMPMLPKPAALASAAATQDSDSKAAENTAPAPAKDDAPAASAAPVSQAAPAPAQEFVVVQPEYKPKAAAADPFTARAADAASKFSGGKSEVALSNAPVMPTSLHVPASVGTAQQSSAMQAPTYGKPKYTGEPISVNLKDVDLKDFFRLIHEISGLNVVLDPNVRGTLTLVLDDVPWDQALDIVLKNNGLERELDGNVLRIATVDTLKHEATARREQTEAQALAAQRITVTRFLSYAHSKDVLPTIKKLLTKRGEIVADERTNALIILDIPQSFAEIDRVLTQLDRKTFEVEIEARVVAATRSFARDIGTQLGFGFTNASTGVGGASAVGVSPITSPGMFTGNTTTTSGGTGSTTTTTGIPLFSNLPANGPTSGLSLINIGSNYRLDAILTAAETRGLVKILSRPRVVTQNNIQAVVRQGVRIPVVTAAQLNGPPTTTYIDAFLRLTVTPQITIDNTIFLNVDVENTTPDFSQQVGGNPTLLTQQATTQVLVTDGGTVVIGGVISTKNSVAVRQVPLLGSVPILGNLFKERAVSTDTQELFFFITPKIIQT